MGCKRYEILLVDMQGQAKQTREWTEAQLLGSVAWLKRMNARGHDVLIRPSGKETSTLLDRLSRADMAKLERSGVPCLAKIEVDADRFQVWLRLGNSPVSGKVREGMTKSLGLPKSDSHKFGALAGFVMHQSAVTGQQNKFVLAHEPVRPGPEATARLERMLKEAEKLLGNQERIKPDSPDKGFSR